MSSRTKGPRNRRKVVYVWCCVRLNTATALRQAAAAIGHEGLDREASGAELFKSYC